VSSNVRKKEKKERKGREGKEGKQASCGKYGEGKEKLLEESFKLKK